MGDLYLPYACKVAFPVESYIVNLEYPLSTTGEPAKNKINLGVEKSFIEETFGKLPLAVNLANNHIMDYGEEGFAKTIAYLEEKKIAYFGAGNEKNDFNNPFVVEQGKEKIAIFGYSCPTTHAVFGSEESNGSAPLEKNRILKDIARYRDEMDKIILVLHWGEEEVHYPKPGDIELAHNFIDQGVDLIIGHHAHVVQSVEKYRGKYIFYGLGNFIFPRLDVPAMYDGKKFCRQFVKEPLKMNREALIVEVDETFKITYFTAFFDDRKIFPKKISVPRWLPKDRKTWKIYKKWWNFEMLVRYFVKNPKIPRLRHIKLLFGIR